MFKNLMTAAGLSVAFASAAAATPLLDFIIDGDTFTQPFSFTNASTEGEQILSFGIDLAGTDLVFDTVNGGVPNTTAGFPFTAFRDTGTTTGLIGSPVIADAATAFEIAFNDFDAGETFQFNIDLDPALPTTSAGVDGNELIGAIAFADFSNGQRVTGVFSAIAGNSNASGFVSTTVTQTPAPVPLPAAGWMLLAGIGGLRILKRRKSV